MSFCWESEMASPSRTSLNLLSKFRGCFLGSLIGDCLGSPFEGETKPICRVLLKSYMEKLRDPNLKVPYKSYTDDTAMTLGVARSLVHNKGFNAQDMAQRFVEDFYAESKRGYGANIIDVFAALRVSCEDPYGPAQLQFNGEGSWGNGAAMRIAPVALFCHNDEDKAVELAYKSSLITHTHKLAYRGAILQCLAVHRALNSDPDHLLDTENFLNHLKEKMTAIEKPDAKETGNNHNRNSISSSYVQALEKVSYLLQKETASPDLVADSLGNSVSAIGSIPTAIYSFLWALKEVNDPEKCKPYDPDVVLPDETVFEKTIRCAIGVGGDADTIASMAGSIAGAFVGEEGIPHNLTRHCEGAEEMLRLADTLHDIVAK